MRGRQGRRHQGRTHRLKRPPLVGSSRGHRLGVRPHPDPQTRFFPPERSHPCFLASQSSILYVGVFAAAAAPADPAGSQEAADPWGMGAMVPRPLSLLLFVVVVAILQFWGSNPRVLHMLGELCTTDAQTYVPWLLCKLLSHICLSSAGWADEMSWV